MADSNQTGSSVPDPPNEDDLTALFSDIAFDSTRPLTVQGGYGDIFAGSHAKEGKVALKRLRANFSTEGREAEILRREARSWRELDHEHLLPFLGIVHYQSEMFLVSPWVTNGSLSTFPKTHPDADRATLLKETAEGLSYLHQRGLVHGDVKAANVLISDNCHAMLADFGLRDLMAGDYRESSVRWQSPELLEGGPRTFESDVFALGMTIYEVLSGKVPFHHLSTDSAVIRAIVDNQRPSIDASTLLAQDPIRNALLWRLSEICCSADPQERLTSSDAAAAAALPRQMIDATAEHHGSLAKLGFGPFTRRAKLSEATDVSQERISSHSQSSDEVSADVDSSEASGSRKDKASPIFISDSVRAIIDSLYFISGEVVFESNFPLHTSGGFCDVFVGRHLELNRVALKRPRVAGVWEPEDWHQFLREIRSWQDLRHEFVLPLYGAYRNKNQIYMVSPYLERGTITDFLAANPSADRAMLLYEIIQALEYLHIQGLIHGDVKGGNILISDDGHVRLADFGLSRHAESTTSRAIKGAGTARYQSPQVMEGQPRTYESDIYAFAMVIVEVLSGTMPFPLLKADSQVVTAVLIHKRRPEQLPARSPSGEDWAGLWAIAVTCWAEDEEMRPSAQQLKCCFQEHLSTRGVVTVSPIYERHFG